MLAEDGRFLVRGGACLLIDDKVAVHVLAADRDCRVIHRRLHEFAKCVIWHTPLRCRLWLVISRAVVEFNLPSLRAHTDLDAFALGFVQCEHVGDELLVMRGTCPVIAQLGLDVEIWNIIGHHFFQCFDVLIHAFDTILFA